MELEFVACDLCGSNDYTIRYHKPDSWLKLELFQFPVVECGNCGLVYVNPRPTMTAMRAFYPQGYHHGRDKDAFIRRYQAQRALLPPLAGKRVLDIGCARGDFLSHLLDREAFEAFGIDAYSTSVDDDRIKFTNGILEVAKYEPVFFDLIMAWAVFEHLHRPSTYFREAARILAPGGKLIILVTNANSLYGCVANMEDVPRHTYHYSKSTLLVYGRKYGLQLKNLRFDDSIFDGRGNGTFRMLAGRISGFTWDKYMHNDLHLATRAAMRLGSGLDAICFATHWEARLRRSGIMIATYEKT